MTKKDTAEYMAKIGRKGGKQRLHTMTAAQRREVAKKAAQARWRKKSA